jgi:hypothetical protein
MLEREGGRERERERKQGEKELGERAYFMLVRARTPSSPVIVRERGRER